MLGFLLVGVICLIIAWYIPRTGAPPPLALILTIVGWVCIAVAVILLLALLLGIPLAIGALR